MRGMALMVSASLLLAGCGGSGGGGGSSGGGGGTVVTPTPTPTPPPTPTPTPTASYAKFADIVGDFTFIGVCNSTLLTGSPPVINPVTRPDNGLAITYLTATQTWALTGDGIGLTGTGLRFGPADLDPARAAGQLFYARPTTAPGVTGFTERLRINQPGAGGSPIEYARLVTLSTAEVSGSPRSYVCLIGVPTFPDDVPAATTVTWSKTGIGGTAYRSASGSPTTTYSLSKSEIAISGNRITGELTTTLHLIGSPLPTGSGADVDFGTITHVADADPVTSGYYGSDSDSWSSPTLNVVFGQIGGRFFGPQGVETGYVATIIAHPKTGPDYELRITGAAFGIR